VCGEVDGFSFNPKCSFPGPISFPFIGSAIQLAFEARNLKHFELFEKLCRKYGPIVKVKAGALDIGNKI